MWDVLLTLKMEYISLQMKFLVVIKILIKIAVIMALINASIAQSLTEILGRWELRNASNFVILIFTLSLPFGIIQSHYYRHWLCRIPKWQSYRQWKHISHFVVGGEIMVTV